MCRRAAHPPTRPSRPKVRRRSAATRAEAPRRSTRHAGRSRRPRRRSGRGAAHAAGMPANRSPDPARSSADPISSSATGPVLARASAAAAVPTASHAARGIPADRHERPNVLERLLTDEASLAQLLDRREGRRRSRGDDLARRHRPDPGQRFELGLRRRIQVDEPATRAGAPARTDRRCGVSSRDGTRTCAPSWSVAARFSSAETRAASTRGLSPPAASIASPTREPCGSRYTPGSTTAPATSTTISPATPSGCGCRPPPVLSRVPRPSPRRCRSRQSRPQGRRPRAHRRRPRWRRPGSRPRCASRQVAALPLSRPTLARANRTRATVAMTGPRTPRPAGCGRA